MIANRLLTIDFTKHKNNNRNLNENPIFDVKIQLICQKAIWKRCALKL